MSIYRNYVKRLLDIVMAAAAIVLFSPLLLGTALLVRIELGRPVLFRQKRPGKNEKIFELYKFRSMTDERNQKGELLPDSARLTKFGRKLRAASLDELPELFNILKGEMSMVGPRPQLPRDVAFMTPSQRARHSVRPGLTGLAQINGRNNITWEEKLNWDMQYIRHISFRTDCAILVKTVSKVLSKEDISSAGMETAEDLGDYLLRKNLIDKEFYNKRINSVIQ